MARRLHAGRPDGDTFDLLDFSAPNGGYSRRIFMLRRDPDNTGLTCGVRGTYFQSSSCRCLPTSSSDHLKIIFPALASDLTAAVRAPHPYNPCPPGSDCTPKHLLAGLSSSPSQPAFLRSILAFPLWESSVQGIFIPADSCTPHTRTLCGCR